MRFFKKYKGLRVAKRHKKRKAPLLWAVLILLLSAAAAFALYRLSRPELPESEPSVWNPSTEPVGDPEEPAPEEPAPEEPAPEEPAPEEPAPEEPAPEEPVPEHPMLELFLPDSAYVSPLDPLESDNGAILRYHIDMRRGTAKAWVFPDGSVFWCEESTGLFISYLNGFSAESGAHLNEADPRSPFLVESADQSILIQPPLARENTVLDGTNYLAADAQNGAVSYSSGAVKIQFNGEAADWWAYLTPGSLAGGEEDGLEWLSLCTVDKFGAANRMTLDGYYYKTPSDYTPTGEKYYYRLPAAYIPSKLARFGYAHHGYQIAAAMLDIQTEYYNGFGYIPTRPTSGWLKCDYGVDAGYYDTRFNTDIAHALLALGNEMKIGKFTDCAMSYAAFLSNHATNHAVYTEQGILVNDYCHSNARHQPTHTSLNHQLAEILFLFETQDYFCIQVANAMLRGIEDTTESWIRDDGNLHYARYPDGSFGGVDYPYLTYNDLLALNRYLGGHEALEVLMHTKQIWMDQNGITAYNK